MQWSQRRCPVGYTRMLCHGYEHRALATTTGEHLARSMWFTVNAELVAALVLCRLVGRYAKLMRLHRCWSSGAARARCFAWPKATEGIQSITRLSENSCGAPYQSHVQRDHVFLHCDAGEAFTSLGHVHIRHAMYTYLPTVALTGCWRPVDIPPIILRYDLTAWLTLPEF